MIEDVLYSTYLLIPAGIKYIEAIQMTTMMDIIKNGLNLNLKMAAIAPIEKKNIIIKNIINKNTDK